MARKRRAARRSASKSYVRLSYWQLLIGAVILIALAIFVINKSSHGKPNVLGVATSSYRNYTLNWPRIPNATGYNIYYKVEGEGNWTHSVRNLPQQSTSYTIGYLNKDKKYIYIVKGYDFSNKEFWWSQPGVIMPSK